jgi:hypothetical protein
VLDQRIERHGRDLVDRVDVGLPVRAPAERVGERRHRLVRFARVPVLAEPPDDEVPLVDERLLCEIHGIGRAIAAVLWRRIEGRFLRDDEIAPGRGRALQHVRRRHHRRRDAGDDRVGAAGLEAVDRRFPPRNAGSLANARDDLGGRERRRLARAGADPRRHHGRSRAEQEVAPGVASDHGRQLRGRCRICRMKSSFSGLPARAIGANVSPTFMV